MKDLGQLNRIIEMEPAPQDWYNMQRVSRESFANRPLYADGGTIAVSVSVLVFLLAVTFQRILGLDKIIDNALRCVHCRGGPRQPPLQAGKGQLPLAWQ